MILCSMHPLYADEGGRGTIDRMVKHGAYVPRLNNGFVSIIPRNNINIFF